VIRWCVGETRVLIVQWIKESPVLMASFSFNEYWSATCIKLSDCRFIHQGTNHYARNGLRYTYEAHSSQKLTTPLLPLFFSHPITMSSQSISPLATPINVSLNFAPPTSSLAFRGVSPSCSLSASKSAPSATSTTAH